EEIEKRKSPAPFKGLRVFALRLCVKTPRVPRKDLAGCIKTQRRKDAKTQGKKWKKKKKGRAPPRLRGFASLRLCAFALKRLGCSEKTWQAALKRKDARTQRRKGRNGRNRKKEEPSVITHIAGRPRDLLAMLFSRGGSRRAP